MRRSLAVLPFMLMPSVGYSYDRAEEVLWACSADDVQIPEKLFAKIHCSGYVTGVLDSAQVIFSVHPGTRFFCPPADGISGDQQVRLVVAWLEAHPVDLHSSARVSVLRAFTDAFPCPK